MLLIKVIINKRAFTLICRIGIHINASHLVYDTDKCTSWNCWSPCNNFSRRAWPRGWDLNLCSLPLMPVNLGSYPIQ